MKGKLTDEQLQVVINALGLDSEFAQRFDHPPMHPETNTVTAAVIPLEVESSEDD